MNRKNPRTYNGAPPVSGARVIIDQREKRIIYQDAAGTVVTLFSDLKRLTHKDVRKLYERRGFKLMKRTCDGKRYVYEREAVEIAQEMAA